MWLTPPKGVSILGWVFPNSNDLILKIPKYAQIAWVVHSRYIQIDNQNQPSQMTSVFNLAQSKITWEGRFIVGLEIVLILPIEVKRSFHGGWHHSLAGVHEEIAGRERTEYYYACIVLCNSLFSILVCGYTVRSYFKYLLPWISSNTEL